MYIVALRSVNNLQCDGEIKSNVKLCATCFIRTSMVVERSQAHS